MKDAVICQGHGCVKWLRYALPEGVVSFWQYDGLCYLCAHKQQVVVKNG